MVTHYCLYGRYNKEPHLHHAYNDNVYILLKKWRNGFLAQKQTEILCSTKATFILINTLKLYILLKTKLNEHALFSAYCSRPFTKLSTEKNLVGSRKKGKGKKKIRTTYKAI